MTYSKEINIGKIGNQLGRTINYQTINSRSISLTRTELLNAFTKAAILTILAGYKKFDYISVEDKFNRINLKKLANYLSYVLNHKEFAPRKYNLKIIDQKNFINKKNNFENNNDYDGILSFSGGMDSTAGLLYSFEKNQHVKPIWISFGQRNDKAELNAVKKILRRFKISPLIVKMDINQYILKGWKDWNYIIPARNFLFVSFAGTLLNYSKGKKGFIYLCAHKDEMKHWRNTDKSKSFFSKASNFFSTENNKKITITTPFANISKTEILSYWRKYWIKKYKISPHETTTCYYERGCGKCEACLKRTISLLAAGYNIDPFIRINPMTDPSGFIIDKWIPQIKLRKFSRIKKLDFLIALEKSLDIIPKRVRRFYNNLPPQTLSAIKRRKEEIDNVKI